MCQYYFLILGLVLKLVDFEGTEGKEHNTQNINCTSIPNVSLTCETNYGKYHKTTLSIGNITQNQ